MKINKTLTALIAGAGLGLSGQAMAAGTLAGADITNTVSLNYKVDSVNQTEIDSNATFRVDNKVIMTLSDNTTKTKIVPGGAATFIYQFANTGNGTQKFQLNVTNKSGSSDTGNITDPTVLYSIPVTAGDTGVYSLSGDVLTMEPDAVVTYEASFTFPKATSSADDLEHNDTFDMLGTALAVQSDGTTPVDFDADKNANKNSSLTTSTLNVAAEAASIDSIKWDGSITAETNITIESAYFTDGGSPATADPGMTVKVLNDPICNPDNSGYLVGIVYTCIDTGYKPKAIPGALVEYTITAKNEGAVSAESVIFTQDIRTISGELSGTPSTVTTAFVTGSLDNVDSDYNDVASASATVATVDHSTSDTNVLTVTVNDFEENEDITITFTAIVE